MLIEPTRAVNAAGNGLILWYQTILPTLLPFAILSSLFISGNMFYVLSDILYPIVRILLPVSREGVFPVFAGFLFGFPMGSRICASMVEEHKLSYDEANIIFVITNNMSPVFISSYIFHHALKAPGLILPAFLSLYLPPLLIGRILLHRHRSSATQKQKNTAPGFQLNFKIMDAAIMNGFETLTKLGGYIMLFSILASLIHTLPIPSAGVKASAVGLIEITNGINCIAGSPLALRSKYLLCILFTAFGGLSGIAQTSSMVAQSRLSIKRYVLLKSIFSLLSTATAALFYPLFV